MNTASAQLRARHPLWTITKGYRLWLFAPHGRALLDPSGCLRSSAVPLAVAHAGHPRSKGGYVPMSAQRDCFERMLRNDAYEAAVWHYLRLAPLSRCAASWAVQPEQHSDLGMWNKFGATPREKALTEHDWNLNAKWREVDYAVRLVSYIH